MRLFVASLVATLGTGAGFAAGHHCDADARTHAERLLRLHYADGADPASVESVSVDDQVTRIAPIKALVGDGHLDVLEVIGHVYRANYRMRFIYAQIPDSCALMGEELLGMSDPY